MTEILQPEQYDQWDEFVRQAKGGTVFHASWYLLALAENVQIRVLRDKAGMIQAGIALTPVHFLGARAARRPEWTTYNGPLIRASGKKNHVEKASEEKNLLLEILGASPRLGMYDYILSPSYADLMPYIWNGFDTSIGYTYQIPPSPPEKWQAAMSSGHRRDLRKAADVLRQQGGSVYPDAEIESCYDLLCDTSRIKRFSLTTARQRLLAWWKTVREHQAGRIYLVRLGDGSSICAAVYVCDHTCGYYMASGIRADARKGPLNLLSRLLIERMILDSHQSGLTFDFEGSVLPGVEHFFRGWGGQCVPKYRVIKIPRPWTYALWCLQRYWRGHRKQKWFVP